MSAQHRKLYAVKKECGVDDTTFNAILLGQVGKESAKDITWSGVEACVSEMRKYQPAAKREEKERDWRPAAASPHVRKIYKLWGILLKGGIVEARYPDGFVERMTGKKRAEWLVPKQANVVIEALIDWIKRDGLEDELQ